MHPTTYTLALINTHTPAPASDTIITPALDPYPVPSVREVMPRHAELIQSALSLSLFSPSSVLLFLPLYNKPKYD